jgi:aryl-alcohol dehydrogenase-like predicted oxidoreductase
VISAANVANHDLLAPLRAIAAAHEATTAQIALAWLRAQQDVFGLPVVPIPGTRSRTRMIENAAGARITLTAGEPALLDPIAAQVAGHRYADMSFASAGRE